MKKMRQMLAILMAGTLVSQQAVATVKTMAQNLDQKPAPTHHW